MGLHPVWLSMGWINEKGEDFNPAPQVSISIPETETSFPEDAETKVT